MGERRPVTVVEIASPSYTGTTWLCLLLGSHARAFALGPPDRVWNLRREGWGDICRVHGTDCPFWPSFFDRFRADGSFYLQLADASGRDVIVINNPGPEHAAAELTHPDLVVRRIRLVRDGRALACSYARHHEVDFYDAVKDYVAGLYDDFPFETDRADVLALRYEELMADQAGHLKRLGEHVGLAYDEGAMRFWEHEHHMTTANAGAIMLLKLLQGVDVPAGGRDRSFYREQHERMTGSGSTFSDERWKEEIGQRERFVFDHFCGRANAAWGYDEDAFTTTERERFKRELAAELRPAPRRMGGRLIKSSRGRPDPRRRILVVLGLVWLLSLVLTWIVAIIVFRS